MIGIKFEGQYLRYKEVLEVSKLPLKNTKFWVGYTLFEQIPLKGCLIQISKQRGVSKNQMCYKSLHIPYLVPCEWSFFVPEKERDVLMDGFVHLSHDKIYKGCFHKS